MCQIRELSELSPYVLASASSKYELHLLWLLYATVLSEIYVCLYEVSS